MAEIPVAVKHPTGATPSPLAVALGDAAAGLLAYRISVADREDRLEAGTGHWRHQIDASEIRQAARLAVLRALAMACTHPGFELLEATAGGAATLEELTAATGLDRLALSEPIADLVSCGVLAKVPERGAVAVTPSGAELVRVVREAIDAATSALGKGH